jgi:hypothetical protein
MTSDVRTVEFINMNLEILAVPGFDGRLGDLTSSDPR